MNVFCLVGKIEELPVLKETPTGFKTCNVLLRVERSFPNSEGVYEHDLFNVEVWRGMAETLCSTGKVNDVLAVKGRSSSRVIQKEGHTYYNTTFVAEKIEFLHA